MTSPAQRHMMRVSAAMTAQREAAPLRHATVYEQMLVKLAADQRTLKAIYSKELKAAKKRELLPFWLPWVIDQPQTPALELQIKVACYMAVLKWEPRVTLSSVTTERSFDGRMTVTLTGQHNDTGQPLSLTIPVS